MNNIENLMPLFLADNVAKTKSPFNLRRMDAKGKRYYYLLDENDEPEFFLSTTTFIKSVLPENKYLTDWRVNMAALTNSSETVDDYVTATADYGTLLHIMIADIVKANHYNPEAITENANQYMESLGIDMNIRRYWLYDLHSDLLAFMQFVSEYNVNVLAVEYPIIGQNIATCIDLIVEMDYEVKGFFGEVYKSGENKGLPKETKKTERVKAIIDIKSGRKGFFDSHEFQLECCKLMWNDYFYGTGLEVTRVYNWSPKDWTGGTPTYNLKDQTESKFKGKFNLFFQIAELYGVFDFNKKYKEPIGEVIPFGEDTVGKFEYVSITEKIRRHEAERKIEQG